jgi:hypothetical protein
MALIMKFVTLQHMVVDLYPNFVGLLGKYNLSSSYPENFVTVSSIANSRNG